MEIFATPENNWSVYDKDKLPEVEFNETRKQFLHTP